MRALALCFALLAFPLSAQDVDISDVDVMRGLLAEQLAPLTRAMLDEAAIIQSQSQEINRLRKEIHEMKPCRGVHP